MAQLFKLSLCSVVLALAQAQQCLDGSEDQACLSSLEASPVKGSSLLQVKTRVASTEAAPTATKKASPVDVKPGHPDAELLQEEGSDAAHETQFILDPWTADGPTDETLPYLELTEEQLKHADGTINDFEGASHQGKYKFLDAAQGAAVDKNTALAIGRVRTAIGKMTSTDAATQQDFAKHEKIWFGSDSDAMTKHVKDHLGKERAVLAGGLEFYVPKKGDGVFACELGSQAYVVKMAPACQDNADGLTTLKSALGCSAFNGKRLIYLCPPFFSTNDQAVNTLVHEGYHQVDSSIIDVENKAWGGFYYDAYSCQEMSSQQKGKTVAKNAALQNAANWEWFTKCVTKPVPSGGNGEPDPCEDQVLGAVR